MLPGWFGGSTSLSFPSSGLSMVDQSWFIPWDWGEVFFSDAPFCLIENLVLYVKDGREQLWVG